jgi:uncharacterized protein with HEPN domain
MPENPKQRFADVLNALPRIQTHCTGKTCEDYLENEVLRGFVERKLLIVGEALARLRQSHPEAAEKITDIHRIIGQRNRIVHGYDAVDDLIIWDAIQNHLPTLHAEVEALLGTEDWAE